MADNIQATPRNYFGGLLSDAYKWMQSPQRTQQMQGFAGLLGTTGVPQTIERMAYGEPLTNIGRANVPLLKPETADALMTVAPVAGDVAQLAGKGLLGAGRMAGNAVNEAMVYGRGPLASITPQPMYAVQPSIVREGNPIQSAVVLIGDRIFTGRTHGDALNRAIYEGVVRKEGGKFIYPKGAEVDSDLFMTKDGQIIDRLQASKMFDIGASETAVEKGLMQNKPPSSMSVDSYIEQAKAIKQQQEKPSFTYPQEEAMRLAQQRAALPKEQGGLGLLSSNTPAERAAAMGFDTPVYHATEADFTSIRPSATGKMGKGIYTSFDPTYAERYAGEDAARTMPLVTRGKMATPELKSDVSEVVRQQMIQDNPDFNMREWKAQSNQALANQGYSGLDVDKERLMFSPEDLRSRFAAFDPWRKTAATAAAMGVAAPDLLAQEQPVITQQQIDDELAKYGLLGR